MTQQETITRPNAGISVYTSDSLLCRAEGSGNEITTKRARDDYYRPENHHTCTILCRNKCTNR